MNTHVLIRRKATLEKSGRTGAVKDEQVESTSLEIFAEIQAFFWPFAGTFLTHFGGKSGHTRGAIRALF